MPTIPNSHTRNKITPLNHSLRNYSQIVAYVDETKGHDETGNGSAELPYQTAARALQVHGDGAKILVWKAATAGTDEVSAYVPISGAALKKAVKKVAELEKKAKKQAEQASEQAAKDKAAAEERERVLEAAKAIVLTEDPALPAAQKIKIRNGVENRGKRVKVSGWVHRLRVQGKNMTFIILRDGTGYLQCVLTDTLVSCFSIGLRGLFRIIVILMNRDNQETRC